MHLLYMCSDLAFAVRKVSQFSSKPRTNHWTSVIQILQYVNSTITYGIEYKEEIRSVKVIRYSDSNFARDKVDQKSTMGYVFLLEGGAIAWSSWKLKSVATSTTEAKYIALENTTKHAIWTQRLLADIHGSQEENGIPVYCDNESSLKLVQNSGYHSRTKHIDVRYHFVRDEFEKGTIKFKYWPTENMLADGMMKPLPRLAFQDKRTRIGLANLQKADASIRSNNSMEA